VKLKLNVRLFEALRIAVRGLPLDRFLADYSFLERDDILAAINYAAYQTDHVVLQTS
jgi:uncharacterized protein (DUF433 family)